jgi:fumarate reductase subunit C
MSTGHTTGQSAPEYTEFHPRWYRKRVSTWWWLGSWRYLKFIAREISSVAVAWAVAVIIVQIYAVSAGQVAYQHFTDLMSHPLAIAVNLIAFAFLLVHTITWFNLAPKATPVRMAGRRVPDIMISGPNYVAWAVVSAFIAWMLVGNV